MKLKMKNNWVKITKQPKSKSWITAEYSTLTEKRKNNKTILVYEEDDDKKYMYGNWRVYFGNTAGNKEGEYWSFKTKQQALKFAEKLMQE